MATSQLFTELHTTYGADISDVPRILLVTGPSGTGKSQLLRFIHAIYFDNCVALGHGFPQPEGWVELTKEMWTECYDDFIFMLRLGLGERFQKLNMLTVSEGSDLYPGVQMANVNGYLPLSQIGLSSLRLFNIARALYGLDGGVLLMDDILNSFHRAVYYPMWQWLLTRCEEQNTQIVATTQSFDCIAGLAFALPGSKERTAMVQFEWLGDDLKTIYHSEAELQTRVKEFKGF